jgi:hypothetical protein
MGLPDEWFPFMARIALLPEPRGAQSTVDARGEETRIQGIIEEEGGRVAHFFWHTAPLGLGEEAGILQLIVVFETRAQYPVSRPEGMSLEMYVRSPEFDQDGDPLTLDPYDMAEQIWHRIDRSNAFLVTEMQEWRRADSFRLFTKSGPDEASDEPIASILLLPEEEDE